MTLGNADAENQELSGLKKDAQVIVNLMRNWKMEKRSENMTKLIELKGINKAYKMETRNFVS